MIQKFIDGTPVPKDYQNAIGKLISGACAATDRFSEDELEQYADQQRALELGRKSKQLTQAREEKEGTSSQ